MKAETRIWMEVLIQHLESMSCDTRLPAPLRFVFDFVMCRLIRRCMGRKAWREMQRKLAVEEGFGYREAWMYKLEWFRKARYEFCRSLVRAKWQRAAREEAEETDLELAE